MHNKNEHLDLAVARAAAYENATAELMKRVAEMKLPVDPDIKYDMPQMVQKFRTAFKKTQLRARVLSPRGEEMRVATSNFSAGFCGISSYTWHHLFRTKSGAPIWQLYNYSRASASPQLMNHVWLKNVYDGTILDLTFDQSVDSRGNFIEIPYEWGQPLDGDFEFNRAMEFGKHIDVDLPSIVARNALRNVKL